MIGLPRLGPNIGKTHKRSLVGYQLNLFQCVHELGEGINTAGVRAFSKALDDHGGLGYIGQTSYMLWRQLDEVMDGHGLTGMLNRHKGVYPGWVSIICALSPYNCDQELKLIYQHRPALNARASDGEMVQGADGDAVYGLCFPPEFVSEAEELQNDKATRNQMQLTDYKRKINAKQRQVDRDVLEEYYRVHRYDDYSTATCPETGKMFFSEVRNKRSPSVSHRTIVFATTGSGHMIH
eukprot:COSAG06_NODE_50_length_28525_cov_88.227010_6_plen_237_part_00